MAVDRNNFAIAATIDGNNRKSIENMPNQVFLLYVGDEYERRLEGVFDSEESAIAWLTADYGKDEVAAKTFLPEHIVEAWDVSSELLDTEVKYVN